jgi:hypothetical protein
MNIYVFTDIKPPIVKFFSNNSENITDGRIVSLREGL